MVGAVVGESVTYDVVLAASTLLFSTGCLLIPMTQGTSLSLGGMLVKFGYTSYQVLFWLLLVRKAYGDPRHAYFYLGVFYGVFELATLVARAGVAAVAPSLGGGQDAVWAVSLFSTWLIGVYGVAFFFVERQSAREDKSAGPSGNGADAVASSFDAFCDTYGLSAREREVVMQSIHGYSMENIGQHLGISRDTVKTHLQRAYRKAGIGGKQGLVEAIDRYSGSPSVPR